MLVNHAAGPRSARPWLRIPALSGSGARVTPRAAPNTAP